MKTRTILIKSGAAFLILAIWLSGKLAFSQQILMSLDEDNNGRKQTEKLLENCRSGIVNRLLAIVDDMNNALNLDEGSLRKLRVAAKGAAEEAMKKNRVEVERQLKQFQQHAGIVEKENDDDNDDQDDEEEKGDNRAPVRRISFYMNMPSVRTGDKNNVWQQTLKKTLSDEQQTAYEKWKTERLKFTRQVAVNNFVSEADRTLFLSPEQRKELTQMLDQKFGAKMATKLANQDDNQRQAFVPGNIDPESKFDKLVEEFLTETQMKEWRRVLASKLRQFE